MKPLARTDEPVPLILQRFDPDEWRSSTPDVIEPGCWPDWPAFNRWKAARKAWHTTHPDAWYTSDRLRDQREQGEALEQAWRTNGGTT